jgi:ATP-dependent helicase/DNAse subunit B
MEHTLIICPNSEKEYLLKELSNTIHNYKFMTKEEFMANYFFSYTEDALYYLMSKYNYNLSVAETYLKNMYVIDLTKTYEDPKLKLLSKLKKELIENNLLTFNTNFKTYLKSFKLVVKNYYALDKYEEDILNYHPNLVPNSITAPVIKCETMEEEVNYVALEIIKLINNNIPLNNIYLTNVSSEYYYTIERLFNYYNIPINIPYQNSIYATSIVNAYLTTNKLNLTNPNPTTKKLVTVLNSLIKVQDNSPIYKALLINKLKHTYLPNKTYNNAITISSLTDQEYNANSYVFVLGLNDGILPSSIKDISYIADLNKKEVALYDTTYLNKRNKLVTTYLLSNIKHLYLSYKLHSPFATYYPSSLINDLKLEVTNYTQDNYTSSNFYNKLRLGEYLDNYLLYGEINPHLKSLFNSYQLPYATYDNSFTSINKETYLNNLTRPLKLSYTSLNSYSECPFKYYLTYVLKLNNYEDTFPAFIGSLYHKILSLYRNHNFNLEEEFTNYVNTRALTIKERVLLIRLKENLAKLLSAITEQDKLIGYPNLLCEQKIDIPLDLKDIEVIFTGTIDKILYSKYVEDTYFTIVDYKSGTIDTHIEPMKYGLHMQLPVYLYLINFANLFTSPIFTGIYYQNILFDYATWSKKAAAEAQNNFKLNGYSIEDQTILARFDKDYEHSNLIRTMSVTKTGDFASTAKLLSANNIYDMLLYTKNYINNTTQRILDAEFTINPKVYDKDNISCKYCTYQDICYYTNKDISYLDKVDNLDFLAEEK